MPFKPQGNRATYDNMGGFAGPISPMPMGVAEAELWPRLNKAMEQLEVFARRNPFLEKHIEEIYRTLRGGLEEYRNAAGEVEGYSTWGRAHTPTLEEIMQEKFQLGRAPVNEPAGERWWASNNTEREHLSQRSGYPGIHRHVDPKAMGGPGSPIRFYTMAKLKQAVELVEQMFESGLLDK